jgi:hypothetical protein
MLGGQGLDWYRAWIIFQRQLNYACEGVLVLEGRQQENLWETRRGSRLEWGGREWVGRGRRGELPGVLQHEAGSMLGGQGLDWYRAWIIFQRQLNYACEGVLVLEDRQQENWRKVGLGGWAWWEEVARGKLNELTLWKRRRFEEVSFREFIDTVTKVAVRVDRASNGEESDKSFI